MTDAGSGPENPDALLTHFRVAMRANPAAAFRDWYRAQEELAGRGEDAACRALADELAAAVPELPFPSQNDRARFLHNLAVFFGSPGPAADLSRARQFFSAALTVLSRDSGWHARTLHNFATALSNLGTTPSDLAESLELFERALEWRTGEHEIARGVTLHHMGVALRRAAELDPDNASSLLERSAAAFREAIEIRSRLGLGDGHALSLFHLALTLEAASERDAARESYLLAAKMFDSLSKSDSAAIARRRADSLI